MLFIAISREIPRIKISTEIQTLRRKRPGRFHVRRAVSIFGFLFFSLDRKSIVLQQQLCAFFSRSVVFVSCFLGIFIHTFSALVLTSTFTMGRLLSSKRSFSRENSRLSFSAARFISRATRERIAQVRFVSMREQRAPCHRHRSSAPRTRSPWVFIDRPSGNAIGREKCL